LGGRLGIFGLIRLRQPLAPDAINSGGSKAAERKVRHLGDGRAGQFVHQRVIVAMNENVMVLHAHDVSALQSSILSQVADRLGATMPRACFN
jgi:hypothetical protein